MADIRVYSSPCLGLTDNVPHLDYNISTAEAYPTCSGQERSCEAGISLHNLRRCLVPQFAGQ